LRKRFFTLIQHGIFGTEILLQIVQARMWAQGLTIGILIVAGALTQSKRKEFAEEVCQLDCEKGFLTHWALAATA